MLHYGNKNIVRNGKWIKTLPPIPPNTVRFRFSNPDYNPVEDEESLWNWETWTKLDFNDNIWQASNASSYYSGQFNSLRFSTAGDIDVLGANICYADPNWTGTAPPSSYGVSGLFRTQRNLKSVKNFKIWNQDTTYSYNSMFASCEGLTEIPDINVSNCHDCAYIFEFCYNVKSGMYEMYQKLAALGDQVLNHDSAFYQCGINTPEGMAERALIPQSWGGDLAGE